MKARSPRAGMGFGVVVVGVATLACITLACDRNTGEFVEGEEPRPPDLARIFPEQDSERPGLSPAMPESQRGNVPPGGSQRGAPPVMADAAASGGTIAGTITVDPALEASVQGGALLFVIARPFGVEAGPPTAVLRIASPDFPLDFEIGPENVMIPTMRFEGSLGISVRLDGDGNAMTRQPGDLAGSAPEALEPGATGVEIVLDQAL